MALETPSRPPPLHSKYHLKFPFGLFEPLPYIEYVCPTWLVEVASSISIFLVADEKIPRPGGSETRVAHIGDILQIGDTCHLVTGPDLSGKVTL